VILRTTFPSTAGKEKREIDPSSCAGGRGGEALAIKRNGEREILSAQPESCLSSRGRIAKRPLCLSFSRALKKRGRPAFPLKSRREGEN